MRIRREYLLDECVERHPASGHAIRRWKERVRGSSWRMPSDARQLSAGVSILPGRRLQFDIMHNRYRIIALVDYEAGVVEVRFAGDHDAYDRINAMEV